MGTTSIHNPARAADESRADYMARRKASLKAVRAMTLRGIGDQHKAPSSREQLRDNQRKNGHGPKGSYGRGLKRHFDQKAATASAERRARRLGI